MGGPIRVLWLIKGLGPGGAERLLVSAAPHVDRERFSYEACYLLPWKDHLAPDLEAAGIPVTCLGVRRALDPSWVGRLRALVRERGHDVVHAHLPYAAAGARVGLRSLRPRPVIVYTEHNTWERYSPATRRLNAATFGWNDAVIAVSGAVAGSIRRPGRVPVHVIPNGVDGEALRAEALPRAEARAELGLPRDGFVVGTVGGLTAKKGHPHLVRAARIVVDRHPEARFVFVGLPADPLPVEDEIARLGLGDRVVLAGYRPDAGRLGAAFDAFCLPSIHEGMPVSLLEAMSLGLPVVATAVGGVPEVATDGEDALLVPPADHWSLAGALFRVIEDGPLREALAARARATAARFGVEAMVRRTEDVYREALAAAGRVP